MSGNSFGTLLKLSTFGESHGTAIGGVLDGVPPGITLNMEAIQQDLDRRKPGQSALVTQRKEPDQVQLFSGVFEGKTTGTPIGFAIFNTNQKSQDYTHIADSYRPSHADYVYDQKYGFRDYRGGGRSSARETAARVVAGAIAKQIIPSISIQAFVSQVGTVGLDKSYHELDLSQTENNDVRCPDQEKAAEMEALIKSIKKEGDTIGGVIDCVIKGVPVGLGEPVFDKLHTRLGAAMLSINAVKGFEYGSGFLGVTMKGSKHNDAYQIDGSTTTNHSGGVQGGISNGMDIYFKVAFKPVATLIQPYTTINKSGELVETHGKGRHDPCVVPRAVPIVEAMAALVIADFSLIRQSQLNPIHEQ